MTSSTVLNRKIDLISSSSLPVIIDVQTNVIEHILRTCAETCILPYFCNLHDDHIQTKTHATDFVTIADHEAEAFLTKQLQTILPGSFVLGEESFSINPTIMNDLATRDHVWIIDPIDGTKNFRNGHDDFCTLLALVNKGTLVGAWIYAPQLDLFAAWQQEQAITVNRMPIAFDTTPKTISEMIVGEHIGHFRKHDKEQLLENRLQFGSCLTRGCFGIETIMMLQNQIDALLFGIGNPWDIAPCAAMIAAAGGQALKINTKAVSGDQLFTIKGAFVATRCPHQWYTVRDLMLKDVPWENYCD